MLLCTSIILGLIQHKDHIWFRILLLQRLFLQLYVTCILLNLFLLEL